MLQIRHLSSLQWKSVRCQNPRSYLNLLSKNLHSLSRNDYLEFPHTKLTKAARRDLNHSSLSPTIKALFQQRRQHVDGIFQRIFPPIAVAEQRRYMRIPAKYEEHHKHKQVKMRDLMMLLEPEKRAFGVAVGGILVSSLSAMAIPAIFGNVVDALSATQTKGLEATMDAIRSSAIQLAGVTVLGSAATFVRASILDIIGQRVGMRLRQELFNNLIDQEIGFFDENRSGELANRLSTDVHEVAEHLVENVSLVLTAGINGIVSAGFLYYISPSLTGITMIVVPTLSVGAYFYGRYVKRLSKELLHLLAQSTQVAAEKFSTIRTVRSFAAEDLEKKRYKKKVEASLGVAKRMAFSEGGYMASVDFVSDSTLLMVVWLGAGMVMNGQLSVGNLASYCMYAHEMGTSVTDLSEGISGCIKAQGAGARLFALLERQNKIPSGNFIPLEPLAGAIQFKGVHFSYPTRPESKVLEDFDLKISPGEVIGITGNSGCGKSTVSALLQHFYEPDKGLIKIDGRPVREYNAHWLSEQIAVVSQEPTLFACSIADNIAYGKLGASQEEIKLAAKHAHIHDFIETLPDKYTTYCGERGVSLSGGQKQRIAIARALLKNPRILILDEATSALDGENSHIVQEALSNLMAGRTTIVIAHHSKQLEQTDRVCVVDHGRVTELGSYGDLLYQEGSLLSRLLVGTKKTDKV